MWQRLRNVFVAVVGCLILVGTILWPIVSASFSEPAPSPRVVDIQLELDGDAAEELLSPTQTQVSQNQTMDSAGESSQGPEVSVVVRYYVSLDAIEPIATETFSRIRLQFSSFQIRLGAFNTESGHWVCADGFDHLDALLGKHKQLWFTVTIGSRREPTRRTRLTETNRNYCHC